MPGCRPTPRRGAGATAAKVLLALACCVLLAIGIGACGDDPPEGPPPWPQPRAVSPDSLLSLFFKAWDDMDVERYGVVLDTAYAFIPPVEDAADLGLEPGQALDRARELAIAGWIFRGDPGIAGAPGIQDVQVSFSRQTDWVASTDEAYPGSVEALFGVEILFLHPGGYLRVTGLEKFWAIDRAPGGEQPLYTVLAQQDFTGSGKSDSRSWAGVKALYSR